jgi:integrase
MGKRGNGEGSITRRDDGRYMARYTVHTKDGPRRKTLYGRTRADVAEKLARALSDRSSGLVFDAGALTLSEYLDRWLSHSVRGSVRQRTFERYEQIARVNIKPTLGRIKLKAITPTHVRGLYREKLDDGLSPRTVQYIHTTLRKALKEAVQDGLIPRNVADAVKAPRPAKVGRIFESPKNGKGRSIKLTPGAIRALRGHLGCQLEVIERAGDRYQDQGLVFPPRPALR